MRIAPAVFGLIAVGFLSACNQEVACTNEVAQQKATDLAARMTELGTSDPAKLAALAPKVQELAAKASAEGDDFQAACKAMDDMMAELAK